MFSRAVEVTSKAGKSKELSNVIQQRVLPLLRTQSGFVDMVVMSSTSDPNRIVAISFWRNQQDAERYAQEGYPKVNEMIRHLLEGNPTLRTFTVESSTTHHIATGQAA